MPTAIATHPSDLFNEVCQTISIPSAMEILGCKKTHIYKQKANPNRNGEARTSFIEKAERMTSAVMDKNPTLARKIVDRLCRICGGRFVIGRAVADKATLREELLDNVPAFAKYTAIMQDEDATIEEKEAAKLALFDEIEQDFDERLK